MSILNILFTELLTRGFSFPNSKISSICLRKSYLYKINLSRISIPGQHFAHLCQNAVYVAQRAITFFHRKCCGGCKKAFHKRLLPVSVVCINNCEDGSHVCTQIKTVFFLWTARMPSQKFKKGKIRIQFPNAAVFKQDNQALML